MFIRLIALISIIAPLQLCFSPAALCAPIDDWNTIILDGSHSKFDGQYNNAIQSFTKAVSFAEKQKLPNKCLPISLCRLAEVQLITNHVKDADSHFEQITNLIKTQKDAKTLDPQVNFWAAALSEAYQSNHQPGTQELCLKHACYLKNLIYGSIHRECTDCLTKLAEFYINDNKVDKAIKILSFTEALSDKASGKNPDRLADTLNELAIKCENDERYTQAEQLELAAIGLAKTNSVDLIAGLPAFYSFLGVNAIAQGHTAENKEYFRKAKQECSKIRSKINKEAACRYLNLLSDCLWSDKHRQNFPVLEIEFAHMLAISQTINTDAKCQYQIISRLSAILSEIAKPKYKGDKIRAEAGQKAVKYLKQAIRLAELPHSLFKQDIPDLYMRAGISQLYIHCFDEANKAFIKAIETEPVKNGFHTGVVYASWGYWLHELGEYTAAAEKLDMSYKIACILPPAKRGTLFADLLQMLAFVAHDHGNDKESQAILKQSAAEIKLQKKLNTHMGPDFFGRL